VRPQGNQKTRRHDIKILVHRRPAPLRGLFLQQDILLQIPGTEDGASQKRVPRSQYGPRVEGGSLIGPEILSSIGISWL
jgi:hypothetical protein